MTHQTEMVRAQERSGGKQWARKGHGRRPSTRDLGRCVCGDEHGRASGTENRERGGNDRERARHALAITMLSTRTTMGATPAISCCVRTPTAAPEAALLSQTERNRLAAVTRRATAACSAASTPMLTYEG